MSSTVWFFSMLTACYSVMSELVEHNTHHETFSFHSSAVGLGININIQLLVLSMSKF